MNCRSIGFVLLALFSGSRVRGAAAQTESGYLVIDGISNGPAQVIVDGVVRGQLREEELTLQVQSGRRRVVVRKRFFRDFERMIDVRVGDVTQLHVDLVAQQTVAVEDRPEGGAATQDVGVLRVVHLQPVSVEIRVDDAIVGNTPATLQVPAGRHVVEVGTSDPICVVVDSGGTGLLTVNAGIVEHLRGVGRCLVGLAPLRIEGLPSYPAEVEIDGERLQVGSLGETPISSPGWHTVRIGVPPHPERELRLLLRESDSVVMNVQVPQPPPAFDTTPLQTRPLPHAPSPLFVSLPPPPIRPDAARISELEYYRRRASHSPRKRLLTTGWALMGVSVGILLVPRDPHTSNPTQAYAAAAGSVLAAALIMKGNKTDDDKAPAGCATTSRRQCLANATAELLRLRFLIQNYPVRVREYSRDSAAAAVANEAARARYIRELEVFRRDSVATVRQNAEISERRANILSRWRDWGLRTPLGVEVRRYRRQ